MVLDEPMNMCIRTPKVATCEAVVLRIGRVKIEYPRQSSPLMVAPPSSRCINSTIVPKTGTLIIPRRRPKCILGLYYGRRISRPGNLSNRITQAIRDA